MTGPFWADDQVTLYHGDCRDVLPELAEASVDAVVCDPPYDLTKGKKGGTGQASLNLAHPAGRSRVTTGGGFMGLAWDATGVAFDPETWRAVLRVLKPGGYLLAFGGTRTWHRLACAIEDAGFDMRDCVADLTGIDGPGLLWVYGNGFPKSLNVGLAVDAALAQGGAETPAGTGDHAGTVDFGMRNRCATCGRPYFSGNPCTCPRPRPVTEEGREWEGWGTALKPAWEPIVAARRPFTGTVAGNVLEHGTGAYNIDGCRVPTGDSLGGGATGSSPGGTEGDGWDRPWKHDPAARAAHAGRVAANVERAEQLGRWPANLIIGDTAAAELDRQSGISTSRAGVPRAAAQPGAGWGMTATGAEHADSGGASRFYTFATGVLEPVS